MQVLAMLRELILCLFLSNTIQLVVECTQYIINSEIKISLPSQDQLIKVYQLFIRYSIQDSKRSMSCNTAFLMQAWNDNTISVDVNSIVIPRPREHQNL